MPTPVGHALGGLAIYFALGRRLQGENLALAVAATASGVLPDLDFALTLFTGRSYHHYFSHSLGFTSFYFLVCYALARALAKEAPLRPAGVTAAAYLFHVGLDLLAKDTSPPFGTQLLWPFSDRFYISPVLVFTDVWRGSFSKLFGLHNWMAVGLEVMVVGPATALLWRLRRPAQAQAG